MVLGSSNIAMEPAAPRGTSERRGSSRSVSRTEVMNALSWAQFQEVLATVDIVSAEPQTGIGRELRHRISPRRTLVIHFGVVDPLDYISGVLSIVQSSQDSWLLVPRHGPASRLGIPTAGAEVEALAYGPAERNQLCSYLCNRDMSIGSIACDLYVLSADGNTVVTWDHHTSDDGLCVAMRDVTKASRLLGALNDFGTELEVYYTNG
jgi:hypothetical protein